MPGKHFLLGSRVTDTEGFAPFLDIIVLADDLSLPDVRKGAMPQIVTQCGNREIPDGRIVWREFFDEEVPTRIL